MKRTLLRGKGLVPGIAEGELLYTKQPLPFLAAIDPEEGKVTDPSHELRGRVLKDRILAFPRAVGSSVGAYVLYGMKKRRVAPLGIINAGSELITVSGCAIAHIPLVDLSEEDFLRLPSFRRVRMDGSQGLVELIE